MSFDESDLEEIFLENLADLGWTPLHGNQIAPGSTWQDAVGQERPNRESWGDLAIPSRVRDAARRLNPEVPTGHLDTAIAELLRPESNDPQAENHRLHNAVVQGFRFTYVDETGQERNPTIRLLDLHTREGNTFLAVNQVIIRSSEHERRLDVVLYVNGLPLVIVELKDAADPQATIDSAHAQLATYLREFPTAFRACAATIVSDGITARYGTPFTPLEHYSPWNVDHEGTPLKDGQGAQAADGVTRQDGEIPDAAQPSPSLTTDYDPPQLALDRLTDGLLDPTTFLAFLDGFIAFDAGEDGLTKRIAKPHQFAAVNAAVAATLAAVAGDGRAGVVWHTQGSGKSMEMELYAAKVMRENALLNPTLVVVTDRTELDGQLYATFERSELLPEQPRRILTRHELREELSTRRTGGILFTTLQKFGLTPGEKERRASHPVLSERSNIILIVDEAHRSHYDDLDGYAWHLKNALPNATLIAFTGTPLRENDRDTRAVFGNVIHTYDLTQAVIDGATVPVYFEPRLIRVLQSEEITAEEVDELADLATVGLDETERDRIEKGVARVNAVYGAPKRVHALAEDIVTHWEERRDAMHALVRAENSDIAPGKALIVAATREIAAALYEEIVALRPDWHSDQDAEGVIKVIYSGDATDPEALAKHVRPESAMRAVRERLKKPDDPLQLAIVKDMLLTGFDAPPLHTLYLDRPMKGALLMQTLARVNRTYRRKNAGLLVATAPVTENLAAALQEYSADDQQDRPVGRSVDAAVALVHELLAEIDLLLAPTRWRRLLAEAGDSVRAYSRAMLTVANYLRAPDPQVADGAAHPEQGAAPSRSVTFRTLAGRLQRAWALGGRQAELRDLREQVVFLSDVRVTIGKLDAEQRRSEGGAVPGEIEEQLAGLVARSVDSEDSLDIYRAAGVEPVRIDTLKEQALAALAERPDPHVAIEQLRNLVAAESQRVTGANLVRQQAFSARLGEIMAKYTNSNLSSAEVMAALFELGQEVRHEALRGNDFDPPLTTDELAFYDAVATNPSALELQGKDTLAAIARDLVAVMRRDAKTDWSQREDVKARLRSSVKRLLAKHRYPPDQQPAAVQLVIEQMELLARRAA
ncbi:type I restriction endonuclease subunit R [Serinibacter salmoneus]|uniref:Type I restriction enzyme endonuclease subunit n=1 Tax=Serinibacter salmoneus TaxID=556530 RepID=A0A2A9D3X9_9MICO|nr:type I restriction endonuclease subunit R [Serinibacter salmoneus]PFG20662.1 type I restriction enzyme R subunit [Serinibacter salmoneus]